MTPKIEESKLCWLCGNDSPDIGYVTLVSEGRGSEIYGYWLDESSFVQKTDVEITLPAIVVAKNTDFPNY